MTIRLNVNNSGLNLEQFRELFLGEQEDVFKDLLENQDREAFEKLLKQETVSLLFLNKAIRTRSIPETWLQDESFQETVSIFLENTIENWIELQQRENTLSRTAFLEHLNEALIAGRYDLAGKLMAICDDQIWASWNVNWSEMMRCVSYGHQPCLNWILENKLCDLKYNSFLHAFFSQFSRDEPFQASIATLQVERFTQRIPFFEHILDWHALSEADWRQVGVVKELFHHVFAFCSSSFFLKMVEAMPLEYVRDILFSDDLMRFVEEEFLRPLVHRLIKDSNWEALSLGGPLPSAFFVRCASVGLTQDLLEAVPSHLLCEALAQENFFQHFDEALIDAILENVQESMKSSQGDYGQFSILSRLYERDDQERFTAFYACIAPGAIEERLDDERSIFTEKWVDVASALELLDRDCVFKKAERCLSQEGFAYRVDEKGRTVLHYAALKKNIPLVELILDHLEGGRLPLASNGYTLFSIVECDHEVIFTKLCQYASEPGMAYQEYQLGRTLLHDAIERDDLRLAKVLIEGLEEGKLPNTSSGESLLKHALQRGNSEMIALLTQEPLWEEVSIPWQNVKMASEENLLALREFDFRSMKKSIEGKSSETLQKFTSKDSLCELCQLEESEERVEILVKLLRARGSLGQDGLYILLDALEKNNLIMSERLLEANALHHPKYSGFPNSEEIFGEMGDQLAKKTRAFRNLFFEKSPTTFFYAEMSKSHDRMITMRFLQEILEVRLGFDAQDAAQYIDEVKKLHGDQDMRHYFAALFVTGAGKKEAENLLDFSRKLIPMLEGEPLYYDEFYEHIFKKFRPELLGNSSELDALFTCFSSLQTNEERAFFFNALQAQHPVDRIAKAVLGKRRAPDFEGDITDNLRYIEVARFQRGRRYAGEQYRKSCSLDAIEALISLAVPLEEDIEESVRERLRDPETSSEIRAGLARLLWASYRDEADSSLKEFVLEVLSHETHGEALEVALELVGLLRLENKEIVPALIGISKSEEQQLRVRAAFALARLQDQRALLRALEIVKSSDWESYDALFRHEELEHFGDWFLFMRKPAFQDNRSSMVQRICDRLAQIHRDEIRLPVRKRLQKERDQAKKILTHNGRYFSMPTYFPKGSLYRGLKERKGDEMLYESIRDLIRHGPSSADLSHFREEFSNTSWCKIGHIFTTNQSGMANKYGKGELGLGVVVEIESTFYNEEALKGRGRVEKELSINNVFYHGIPWQHIKRVYLPLKLESDFLALSGSEPLHTLGFATPVFDKLSQPELEDLRFYLNRSIQGRGIQLLDLIEFGMPTTLQEIEDDAVRLKSLKRQFQRDEVKKLYPIETALPDEIF